MEGSRFYLLDANNNYKMGELIWYLVISSVGFLAQLIVLIKVIGCTLSSHFLRLYYILSSVLLLSMATIVTAIAYAEKQSFAGCNTANMTLDVTKLCLKQAIIDINGDGGATMTASQFGFEFAMFLLTALTGFLFAYSFVLTFCKPKSDDKSDRGVEDKETPAEPKPSWPPAEFDIIENANQVPSRGDRPKASSLPRPTPSAPPLVHTI